MEKEMATHPNILAWRIPWTEKPARSLAGYSPWGHRESDTTEATSLSVLLGHTAKSETSLAIQWLNFCDSDAGFNPWSGN